MFIMRRVYLAIIFSLIAAGVGLYFASKIAKEYGIDLWQIL